MVATGFSVIGATAFFDQYRPAFLMAAVALLCIGFYLNYRPQEASCASDPNCPPSADRLRRWNLGLLWTSTALVAALAFFPEYVGSVLGAQMISIDQTAPPTLTLNIEGMTCTGCEAAVEATLSELPEISAADVSYETGQGVIQLAGATPPTQSALAAAVGKAGYRLASVSESADVDLAAALSGHWLTELKEENGESVEVIMDLGVLDSRWVGEFDLRKHGIENYPVEVTASGVEVQLFLTALGTAFEGSLSSDGQTLRGIGRVDDQEEEIVFRKSGRAVFSEGFLRLEAAADDESLVETLSDNGAELRELFNADVNKIRLLMLLSPT
jgi:copper chaperone CopZ